MSSASATSRRRKRSRMNDVEDALLGLLSMAPRPAEPDRLRLGERRVEPQHPAFSPKCWRDPKPQDLDNLPFIKQARGNELVPHVRASRFRCGGEAVSSSTGPDDNGEARRSHRQPIDAKKNRSKVESRRVCRREAGLGCRHAPWQTPSSTEHSRGWEVGSQPPPRADSYEAVTTH